MDDLDRIELSEETKALLREKQTELVKIIDALSKLENSKEWGILKDLIFDKALAGIERQILNIALAKDIDVNALYKLQGEWAWSKHYNDLRQFGEVLKKQLEDIKSKLK